MCVFAGHLIDRIFPLLGKFCSFFFNNRVTNRVGAVDLFEDNLNYSCYKNISRVDRPYGRFRLAIDGVDQVSLVILYQTD